MVSVPKHVCKVSELQDYSLDLQILITDPRAIDKEKMQTSVCEILDINYSDYLGSLKIPSNQTDLESAKAKIKDYFSKETMPAFKKCDAWVYDQTDYDKTAITEVG